jgi:aldose sugar dehydrogenase
MRSFLIIIPLILLLVVFGCNERLDNPINNVDNKLDTTIVAKGLYVPWEVLWSPENELWVTERGGRVLKIDPETREVQELIKIQVTEEGESGLLGMALHPDFPFYSMGLSCLYILTGIVN